MSRISDSFQKHTDSLRGFLIVTLLGLPFIWPLLRWTSVPCTHDGHLHYHRVAAMRHAWENGVYFSRWLPDLAFGYGFPFFVFREPLPLFLTQFFFMAGLPLPAATNLFYILCLLASGWFMFLWARDIFGATAGVVSAAAYMLAPYLLIDVYVRGNQVESLGLALLPLILWSGRRFVQQGGFVAYVIGICGLVVLSLSHNISLFLFAPFLGLYLLYVGWSAALSWRTIITRLGLLCVLGLGITLFYTGTAVLEIDSVALDQSVSRRNNDFHFNFAALDEIFSPVPPEDPQALNPPLPLRLGWAPAALALLGLLSLPWQRNRARKGHILFMAAAALIYLLMSLEITTPLWENIPLIDFVQFPWRFVGRAALPVALLAGAGAALGGRLSPSLGDSGRAWLLAAAALLLLTMEALPYLYPAICAEEPRPTILSVHEYEAETGMVGVDPTGSYFPRTVAARPDGSPLQTAYAAGSEPLRFDTSSLPAGATLLTQETDGLTSKIQLETPVDFEGRYLTFVFPGWRVHVNGERVPLVPTEPAGLISFNVPAGTAEIVVRWGSTPQRSALGALSLLALAGVVLVGLVLHEYPPPPDRSRRPLTHLRAWLVLALLIALLKFAIVDQVETPLRRAAAPPVSHETAIQGAELRLAGYNISPTPVPSGETFDVDLAWQVLAAPAAVYQSNLWLADENGLLWSLKETERTRLYEDPPDMRFWPAGSWAWDSREVATLSGTPPGVYDLVLTLFRLDDLQPLTLTAADGAVLGPTTIIGQVEVTAPTETPVFSPQVALAAAVAGRTLLGYNQDRASAAPGEALLLTLFWSAANRGADPAMSPLILRDETGAEAASWPLALPALGAEARQRGQYLLRLPAGLTSGIYQFQLENQALGQLEVRAPERNFEQPLNLTLSGAVYGEAIELVGYELRETTAAIDLRLVWRGLVELPLSYRVFVHLVADTGEIVAQSDSEPAGWRRPTSGWAPGEFITDEHRLTLSAVDEAYSIRVGLYDPATGLRVPVVGGEFVVIDPTTD